MPRGDLGNTGNTGGESKGSPLTGKLVQGTPEQEAVWNALLNTDKHVIVEAVAGSGKTFTITQYAMREKERRIGLVAFNKHIATELTARMGRQANVECMTYHSLGFKAVRNAMRHRVNVDQYKTLGILDSIILPCSKDQEKVAKYRISALVSLAKTYGKGPNVSKEELEEIADRHDLDFNGLADLVLNYTPKVLGKCRSELSTVDFDDMVWLPMELGLSVPKYDVLCVDEYQDTGLTQQWLAVEGGKRICAVGDPRQAIYQFRGADSKGFDRLRERLGDKVLTLPLTLTRRCPKAHVRLAQTIVPQIQAMEDAPEGVVRYVGEEQGLSEMQPGDLVVCRVNAPLIGNAYKLIKQGKKAVVRGRDIGQGIGKLLEHAIVEAGQKDGAVTLTDVLKAAGEITGEAVRKFRAMPHNKGEMRAMAAEDKYACLFEIGTNCKTVQELKASIESLFADFEADGTPKNAVVLGTVHRTKGLEGNRVYVLAPELIPHPMARGESARESEYNLAYVAVTRAKFEVGAMCTVCGGDGNVTTNTQDKLCPPCNGTGKTSKPGELVFVGGECSLFPSEHHQWVCCECGKVQVDQDNEACEECEQALMLTPAPPVEAESHASPDWDFENELDAGGIPEHRRWK